MQAYVHDVWYGVTSMAIIMMLTSARNFETEKIEPNKQVERFSTVKNSAIVLIITKCFHKTYKAQSQGILDRQCLRSIVKHDPRALLWVTPNLWLLGETVNLHTMRKSPYTRITLPSAVFSFETAKNVLSHRALRHRKDFVFNTIHVRY